MWAGRATGKRVAALALLLALVFVSIGVVLSAPGPVPDSGDDTSAPIVTAAPSESSLGPPPLPTLTGTTVTFGSAGDFSSDAPTYPITQAMMKRLAARGGTFILAAGDLGYHAEEQPWCNAIKTFMNKTIVVAGNHDTTQSGPGDINSDVIYCPFNMGVTLVAGPNYGYGISFYFDYPAVNPLVRFVAFSAGISSTQTANQNYNVPSGADYVWLINAVTSARAANIPWVVAWAHKLCLNAGSYGCEIGQSLWDGLITAGADLLLTGHYHVYERSYQLNHNSTLCTTVSSGGYNSNCVANFNHQTMAKGAGIMQVTDGAAGTSIYNYDGSGDGQYFPVYMMSDAVSEPGKQTGWGPTIISLNATTMQGSTAFCPGTTYGSDGECPSQASTTFQDSWTIGGGSTPPPPPPSLTADFTFTPTNPQVGQAVTFTGTASGGTAPYSFSWNYGDSSTATGATVSHAYAQPGNYSARLTVTDAGSKTATATKTVAVTAPPPAGSPTAAYSFSPSFPIVGASVNFNASASSDPNGRPLQVRWDWTNDGTFDTAWSSTRVATHAYSAAGTITAKLQVRNDVGSMDNATLAIPVDGSAPVTTSSISGTAGSHGWYRGPATVTLTATDDVSGVASTKYRKDNGSWSTYSSPFTVSGDGSHSVDYYSVDHAGQTESTHTILVRVDQTPPTTVSSLQGTQDGNGSYLVSANVTLTASDSTSGIDSVAYRIDSGAWQGYASTFLVTGSGTHVVNFRSTDLAGNVEASKSTSFTIAASSPPPPSEPPVTSLALVGRAGTDSWYTSAVTVTLNATSPSSPSVMIAYRLDGGAWRTYRAPFSVADGLHTLEYNATDGLGDAEAVHTATFKVDEAAPQTTAALSGTSGRDHWYITPVSVRLSAADAVSGVLSTEYRLDAGAWQSYTDPVLVGNGRHVLDYRSTDHAGLTEVFSSTAIKVDGTPPRLAVSPSGGIQTISTVVISWTESDDVAGVVGNAVSVDGVPFADLGLNTTATMTLPDGDHTIGVRAIDDAANVAWANVTLRVDTNLFSPTGPLQGMPSYLLVVIVAGFVLFFVVHRRSREKRMRRQQALVRMRARMR